MQTLINYFAIYMQCNLVLEGDRPWSPVKSLGIQKQMISSFLGFFSLSK